MRIIGTGSSLPSLVVTNDMLAEFLDTSDTWIRTRTGIRERRLLSTEHLRDIAVKAICAALEDAGIRATDLDYIICSNVANNYVTPSFSAILQGDIGATCPTIDINAACAGFIYAMDIAESFLLSKSVKNILIVCAEEPSRYPNWKERDASILFADGAAALVVTQGDALKAMTVTTTCNIEPLYYQRTLEPTPFKVKEEGNAPLVMKGRDVFKLAVTSSLSDIQQTLKKAGISSEEIRFYVLHQANMRIIETIRQQLELPTEKFPTNIERVGNTSSASIPILIDELNKSHRLEKGDMLLFSAFGAGFTTGCCIIEWTNN